MFLSYNRGFYVYMCCILAKIEKKTKFTIECNKVFFKGAPPLNGNKILSYTMTESCMMMESCMMTESCTMTEPCTMTEFCTMTESCTMTKSCTMMKSTTMRKLAR